MSTNNEPRKLKRVVIKEELVALTGKVDYAIVLQQFIYWSERVKDVDKYLKEELKRKRQFSDGSIESPDDIKETLSNGWIYKTSEQMKEECMFEKSVATMDRIIKALVDNKWLDRRNNPKYKWDKTYQYRVNLLKIQNDLIKIGYVLEGYSLGSMDLNRNEEPKPQNEEPKPQNEEPKPQNEEPKPQNEEPKPQNEELKPQNEELKPQNEGAIPKITTNITLENTLEITSEEKDDDDDINTPSKNSSIFIQELLFEAQEVHDLPEQEKQEIIDSLDDGCYNMKALEPTFDKVVSKWEKGEVSSIGPYFLKILNQEQRRIERNQKKKIKQSTQTTRPPVEFKPHNWLDGEE